MARTSALLCFLDQPLDEAGQKRIQRQTDLGRQTLLLPYGCDTGRQYPRECQGACGATV